MADEALGTGAASRGSASSARWLVAVACLAVALLGVSALVGWALRVPWLTSLGQGLVPMAPSTAFLFLAHGAMLGLLVLGSRPPNGRVIFVQRAAQGLLALLALTLLATSSQGVFSRVEHLGLDIAGEVGGVPVGHMSPFSAAGFLIASLSLWAATPGHRPWRRSIAVAASGALVIAAVVFLLAYFLGEPQLIGGPLIPVALSTALAFLALGLGHLLWSLGRGALPWALHRPSSTGTWLFLAFVLLASGLVVAGHLSLRGFARQHRAEKEQQLRAVADLKVRELVSWRSERLGDGLVFHENESFAGLVQQRLERPADPEVASRLMTWLGKVREAYRYDRVSVVDPEGGLVAAYPAQAPSASQHQKGSIVSSLREGRVTLLDLHRSGPGRPIHMAVVVPLYSTRGQRRPLGALVLRIDPTVHLYPLIRTWPVPSRTAETLLVRREGEHVLFLNELRFHRGAALTLRLPLSQRGLPAAMAVRGFRGVVAGRDYRGREVLAVTGQVPGSPWSLVARMDFAEVQAPLKERLWQMVALVAALVFGAGAAFGLIWRRQSLRQYRERLEAAQALGASEAELRLRNDELTRFTYTVSHDLKSPLVTIQTFLGYLEQDLKTGDAQAVDKDFGFIQGAARKMSRLLGELLALSRVGRTASQMKDVPLGEVVGEALGLVAGQVAARGVRVAITEEPILLHGDRTRLVEVFQNLLDNAVKFMGDQPDPLVEIGAEDAPDEGTARHGSSGSAARGSAPGGEIVLFVRDNGAGIDPRHLCKVFGLFEKLDPGGEGTGIGLALVQRIVEAHGGRIWAESEGPGRGACFRFTVAGTQRAPGEDRS